jgi:endonuclease/exonuclease/phosphatase (EEP) superfamily protein YafD
MSPVMANVARKRPQLPGSWEGGSNLTLVKQDKPGGLITHRRNQSLCWWPERRALSYVRLAGGLCVANLHASTGRANGEKDVLRAARLAVEWAGDQPLVFGGDLNIRPKSSPVFEELHQRYGFSEATEQGSIDHLLVRNAEVVDPTVSWKPERRDVPDPDSDLSIRLSDHSPVVSRITA